MDGRVGLPNGMMLDETYRIDRVIGSGGFGITYEAEDMKLGTKVAIKEYFPANCGQRNAGLSVRPTSEKQTKTFEWGRTSFLEEACTLARFQHPSVVRISRVFEAHSTAYMVMLFEQGRSFEAWLKSLDRAPSQEELDRISGPLLDALEIVHTQNFLHRDIAPDNIIVRADGSPVLLDFGSARRAVAERSRALTGVVKTGYSPQEQYTTDGRLQGPWTDLYAFGATLYRAVTGKPPEEATLRAMDDQMRSAAGLAGGPYRPGFLSAIDECLRVRPSERPQSVAQLRPMLLAPASRAGVLLVEPLKRTSRLTARVETAVKPPGKKQLIPAAAIFFVLVGGFAGLQYARWAVEAPVGNADQNVTAKRAADDEAAITAKAKEAADATEAKRKAEENATAKRAVDEKTAKEAAAKKTADAAEMAAEADAWVALKDLKSIPAFESFIARYPDSPYAAMARARVAELRPDGRWIVNRLGPSCLVKKWDFLVVISKDRVEAELPPGSATGLPMGKVTGTVTTSGEIKFRHANQFKNLAGLEYKGQLTGSRGGGTFSGGGGCSGTFTLTRE
jgi:Protein kinase domain